MYRMKYQALKHKSLKLESKAQLELDAEDDSIILIPEEGTVTKYPPPC